MPCGLGGLALFRPDILIRQFARAGASEDDPAFVLLLEYYRSR